MNGTTEVTQEYDQRYIFFFVHVGLVPEKKHIYIISEFRRTIENPRQAEINEFPRLPPAS